MASGETDNGRQQAMFLQGITCRNKLLISTCRMHWLPEK